LSPRDSYYFFVYQSSSSLLSVPKH
jgi:hypothetical protein